MAKQTKSVKAQEVEREYRSSKMRKVLLELLLTVQEIQVQQDAILASLAPEKTVGSILDAKNAAIASSKKQFASLHRKIEAL